MTLNSVAGKVYINGYINFIAYINAQSAKQMAKPKKRYCEICGEELFNRKANARYCKECGRIKGDRRECPYIRQKCSTCERYLNAKSAGRRPICWRNKLVIMQ